MLTYRASLKLKARHLRRNMTDSESVLWTRLRKRQILGVQFYRQKPIGSYIVDFYAPTMGLVIEVDGSQHMESDHAKRDKTRDEYLRSIGASRSPLRQQGSVGANRRRRGNHLSDRC